MSLCVHYGLSVYIAYIVIQLTSLITYSVQHTHLCPRIIQRFRVPFCSVIITLHIDLIYPSQPAHASIHFNVSGVNTTELLRLAVGQRVHGLQANIEATRGGVDSNDVDCLVDLAVRVV